MARKAKVVVVGYGVVGKRIADAVQRQEDMEVAGVVDVVATALVEIASSRGFPVFAATSEALEKMQRDGLSVAGGFRDALANADLIVDTSPEGVMNKNLPVYAEAKKPFIINGGEKHEVTGFSFSALANYRKALGVTRARVVSCNTNALCRTIVALRSAGTLAEVFVAVVRRGADPVRTSRGPINATVPVLGGLSHHAPDVNTVIPDVHITSLAVKISATLAHVHMVRATFDKPVEAARVITALNETPRIVLVSGAKGVADSAQVLELFRDKLRPRGDMWEVAVWEDSVRAYGSTVVLTYCVHQEAIAVPENVDAIRAMLQLEPNASKSIEMTDKALGCFQPHAKYDAF